MGPASEEVALQIEQIRSDRSQGATALARSALSTLTLAAQSSMSLGELEALAGKLSALRPAMAPIRNIAFLFVQGLKGGISPYILGRQMSEHLEQLMSQAAIRALSIIPTGATVLTCSYSSYVVSTLSKAHAAGRNIRVLVLESRVGSLAYGERLQSDLAHRGLMTELVPDDSLTKIAPSTTTGLIGVDRVHPDGSLVNGVPSLQLAHGLRGIARLYAVGDSLRFVTPTALEEGFDLVPASLVTGYLLEGGLIIPQEVGALPHWRELELA